MKMIITKGIPYPLGARSNNGKVHFSFVSPFSDCGVVLYEKKTRKEKLRIAFPEGFQIGNVHCMYVQGVSQEDTAYCFYEKDRLVTDVRGRAFLDEEASVLPACFPAAEYDWEGDRNPNIPYEESIGYCLHVKGFTRHASSGVKEKGTFLGLTRKIPYLKALGVTTLELQPVNEFSETEKQKGAADPFWDMETPESVRKNYWGYKEGCYYSPKNSYSFTKDAVTEFKDMVKLLHRNGLEVILQFYFTSDTPKWEIPEILRHWVMEYHVDGFHLKGENIVPDILATDPALSTTKLWYYDFPNGGKEGLRPEQSAAMRYLAEYKDDFRYDMRRFLKGDEGMLSAVMYHLRRNPDSCGQINYLTNYDGFTLMDLVSYERKHNEENGEENRDGNDYNASWNCGQEGPSRKKAVVRLRMKQIKNALLLLFLSQGTPLIFMGDEFGNSQKGNNNPYCQDNEITWLNWKNLITGKEIYEFTRTLIDLRKGHPVLRQPKEARLMDYGACGYPDVSYHGEMPWKPDSAHYSRQLGVMYCGKYAFLDKKTEDDFFYVAYNMHWEPYAFAMPRLPKDLKWTLEMITDEEAKDILSEEEQPKIQVPGRCICLFRSEKQKKGHIKQKTERKAEM